MVKANLTEVYALSCVDAVQHFCVTIMSDGVCLFTKTNLHVLCFRAAWQILQTLLIAIFCDMLISIGEGERFIEASLIGLMVLPCVNVVEALLRGIAHGMLCALFTGQNRPCCS